MGQTHVECQGSTFAGSQEKHAVGIDLEAPAQVQEHVHDGRLLLGRVVISHPALLPIGNHQDVAELRRHLAAGFQHRDRLLARLVQGEEHGTGATVMIFRRQVD